jgi:hypothetical protein
MSIIGSDPLAFLLAKGGIVGTPLQKAGASGAENLDVQQRGAVIGEPIPIVFCRRVSGVGGVLISPAATEARFEDNNPAANITASYHLVLSEGQIDSIQVRDVFQRSCRVGSFSQTYGKRAGTFIPGNFITNTPGLEAPYFCGTGGRYTGLSTLAFTVTIPEQFDYWNRQVHCFVRGGLHVPRLLDSVTGPSNNVADLLLYLLRNSSKVPEAQIDTASLLAAATFTNANGFWFNGSVSESTNLRDWIGDTLPYFLLRQTRIGGKEALTPLLPTNSNGTIKTTPVSWAFTFTEQHIIPGSFEIVYTPLADRKPFCATVLWRQQDDLGIPVMRTAEVRYAGTAIDGPFEQHDLSGFCASENHAVKVGAYILSKRRHVSHRLQIRVRPDGFNTTLASGDLVRVRLERVASTGAASVHDFLYEVDRIGKSITGEVQLELTHFPVDADLASAVAQEVAAAVGSGYVLPTGLSGVTCDINSSFDVTIPEDISLDPEDWDLPADNEFDFEIDQVIEGADFGDGSPTANNPDDGLDIQDEPFIVVGPGGDFVGQTYSVSGADDVQWTADGEPIPGATGDSYTSTISDIGKVIGAEASGKPIGYGTGSVDYVGSSDPPPPAAGANPQVRLYWIVGNVYCLNPSNAGASVNVKRGGTCTQGRAVYGYVTTNWNSIQTSWRLITEPYDPDGCLTRPGCNADPATSCGAPFTQFNVFYPYGLPDVCDETRIWARIQLFSGGSWTNWRTQISNYVGHNVAPSLERLVVTYAP